MSKHKFPMQNPSIYLFQLDLLYLLICYMGMRNVSIEKTIQFIICKISDIGCAPPLWTVLVSWYPHYVLVHKTYWLSLVEAIS